MSHVLTVIRRIVDALPINTNHSLDDLEADAVLIHCCSTLVDLSRDLRDFEEILAELLWALNYVQRGHQYEYNAKERLASQLYLLRIISACSINAATGYSTLAAVSDVPPLSAFLVERVLTCAVNTLSSVHPIDRNQATPASVSSQTRHSQSSRIEPVADGSSKEVKPAPAPPTAMREHELHLQTLVTFVSAMNWSATFGKLAAMLRQPYIEDFEDEYNQKVRHLAFFTLNLGRLDAILVLMNSVFNTLQKSTQLCLAESLSTSLSTWIDGNPQDVLQLYREPRRILTADGVQLFETLLQHADSTKRRAVIWPLLANLLVLYPGDTLDPSGRAMKRSLFLQNLNRALGESRQSSTICFVSYARIFQTVCGLEPESRLPISHTLNEIIRAFWVNPSHLRDCACQRDFTAATLLFRSFFRMNFAKGKDFATSTIATWLQENEDHYSKVSAVKATEAILSDPMWSSAHDSASKTAFLTIVSPHIRALWESLVPSTKEGSEFEPSPFEKDLVDAILSLFCAAPEIAHPDSSSLPTQAMDTTLIWSMFQDGFSSETTIARYILELHKIDAVEGYIFRKKVHQDPERFWHIWLRFTEQAMFLMLRKVSSDDWADTTHVRSLFTFLLRCAMERVACLKKYWHVYGTAEQFTKNSRLLETLGSVILMLTCHVDVTIATKAVKACSLIVAENEIYQTAGFVLLNDNAVFSSLARETFLTVGRNSVQKKIRNCLRSGIATSSLHVAWTNIYARWCKLADQLSTGEKLSPEAEQKTMTEWQNYVGFLTSAGRLEGSKHDASVLDFIGRFRELFTHQEKAEFISEGSAETLGTELHLSLFVPMLQEIQSLVTTMKDKKGFLIIRTRSTRLAEHLILICRGLFDRLETYLEVREDINVGEILLDLANYLELCGQNTLRPRLRFSQLCEILATKFDLLCISGEKSTIRRLCNYVALWISEPDPLQLEMRKISHDTNAACLRALARLSIHMRLAYEPLSEGKQIAADVEGLVNFVLPLLRIPEDQATKFGAQSLVWIQELLTNVLSTNQRLTLTTYISLCYSPDAKVRDVFSAAILSQLSLGINALQSPSQNMLCETLWLMISKDRDMTTALLDGASPQYNVADILLEMFHERGSPAQLFSLIVDTEIQICSQESELYRRNSPTTRLFATYAKRYATSYVDDVIHSPMQSLASRDDDYSMEIDISKITAANQEDLAKALETNRAHLQSTAQEFIDAICASASKLPFEMTLILRVVAERTALKYPGAVHNSVGSFLILRLLGPAIMNHIATFRSIRMRRQVVVIVKLLTNLASNTFFKEKRMTAINDFLRGNVFKLSKFLADVSSGTPELVGDSAEAPRRREISSMGQEAHFAELHRVVFMCHDRIKLKWIEVSLSQGVPVKAISRKLGIFKHMVSQFGPPNDLQSVNMLSAANSAASSTSGRSQKQAVPASGNSSPKGIMYWAGSSQGGRPVICLQLRELQFSQVNQNRTVVQAFEGFMDSACPGDTEVFVDVTGFSSLGEHQDWTVALTSLLVADPIQNCHSLYFYNCSSTFLSFFKIHISNMLPLGEMRIRFLDLSESLERYFEPRTCARLAKYGPVITNFPNVMSLLKHRTGGQNRAVKLSLYTNVVLFSSVQKYDVCLAHKTRLIELLSLSDIMNVQLGDDFLVVLLKDQTVLRLETDDPQMIATMLRQATQQPSLSNIENERTNANEDRIRALLLCLAFVKIGSADGRRRESGASILRMVLGSDALRSSGLGPDQTTDNTRLDYSELRRVHRAVYVSCNTATKKEFIYEILTRLPLLPVAEGRPILHYLDIWLEDIASGATTLDATERSAHIRTIVMSLVSFHSSFEDTIVWETLWLAIGREKCASDLVLESLMSYAILFRYKSAQVITVSQILRIFRGPSIIDRLAEMLVAEILAAAESTVTNLMLAKNWHEIEVVLLLLVDSSARTTETIECLPEIFFSAFVLCKFGTLDVRNLTYRLVINAMSACIRSKDPQSQESIRLKQVLEAFNSKTSAANFVAETGKVLEGTSLEAVSMSDQNKELYAGEFLIEKVEQMVEVMRLSASTESQETQYLTVFSQLMTDTAFPRSCLSRRTVLALGVLSADLGVQATRPLVEALIDGLEEATMRNSRNALAMVICLTLMPFEEVCHNLKLGIGLCMSPMSSLASGGLRMVHVCLSRIVEEGSGSQVVDCCLKSSDPRWAEYEASLGMSVSTRPSLGLCCVLLQALKATNSLDIIKKTLLLLVKLYRYNQAEQFEDWFRETLPPLALLCAFSGNSTELRSTLAIGNVDLSKYSDVQATSFLSFQGRFVDETVALPLALMLSSLLTMTSNQKLQTLLLNALNDAAHTCPNVFDFIYHDLDPFLKKIFATSSSLPCLKAAQEMIQRHQELNTHYDEDSPTTIDREQVKSMGFELLLKPHDFTASEATINLQKHCFANYLREEF